MSGHRLMVYTQEGVADIVSTGLDAAERVGFDIDRTQDTDHEDWPHYNGSYETTTVGFMFDVSEDREPHERVLSVGLSNTPDPSNWSDEGSYTDFVDAVVALACECARVYDAAYVALLTPDRHSALSPTGTPFAEHIDQAPRLAVYSRSLLADLGGTDALYGEQSRRRTDLDSSHTLVVTADGPWQDTEFAGSESQGTATTSPVGDGRVSDPFETLDTGSYGTDAVITKSDLNLEFTNEALTLERCYRDESGNLRRIEDDSFVRRVIGDDGPKGELPNDVDPDDERLSALLNPLIPPAFVRMEAPDGETAVSKTLALDIETSKFDLLVSLARTARAEDVDEEVVDTIDGVLTELGGMDGADGIDQYIQTRLL